MGRSGYWVWAAVVTLSVTSWHSLRAEENEGKPSETTDTYVDDSFEARELLTRLKKLERAGDWQGASRLVETIHATYGARLAEVKAGLYESLSGRLCRIVSHWPAAGLAVYRELHDSVAREHYEAALRGRDLDALLLVFERYSCTSWGVTAAAAAVDLGLESGDFATARRVCLDVVERDGAAASFIGRLAILAALEGHEGEAERWVTRHDELSKRGTVRWSGRDVGLVQLVRSLASDVRASTTGEADVDWPVFGGDMGRNRAGSFVFGRMALLWRFDGFAPGTLDMSLEDVESATGRQNLATGRFLVLNPVVGAGLVFFQDADDVWALQRHTGTEVWHYGGNVANHGSDSEGVNVEWFAPALSENRLYVCVGSDSAPFYGDDSAARSGGLLCLGSRTGHEIWRLGTSRLKTGSARVGFGSSPMVSAGSVYVVVRRRRTFGFEDSYLVRVRASDGSVVYETHLGSASIGGFGYRRSTLGIPAMVDGTVYVATHLGSVAAVSARTGRVRWIRTYRREAEADWRARMRASSRDVRPWHFNAVLRVGDRLVCRPNDARVVLVLDRSTGDIVRTIDAEQVGGATTLLGVDVDRLIVAGWEDDAAMVYAVDTVSGEVAWRAPLPEGSRFLGRGVLANGRAVVPTDVGICGVDLSDGAVAVQAWEGKDGSGNLLALPDLLLVAGNDHVSAYGRKADIWKRLRRRMAEHPDAAGPALELAEIAFRTGNVGEAETLLLQGIERAGGFAGMVDDSVRRRVFEDCLRFAREWPPDAAGGPSGAVRFYEYASQCAPDREGHVTYRLRFAEFLGKHDEAERAVGLYQQILNDGSLREVWVKDETAAANARHGIVALIAQHGQKVYASFDAEAATWLEAARASDDMALLDRLLSMRPAARVVFDAMVLKGSLLRRRGQPIAAARVLGKALHRFGNRSRNPVLMRSIADCYADAGRPESAWAWLTKASENYPRARVEVEGQDGARRRVSLRRYRERFASGRAMVEVRRPAVKVPLSGRFEHTFDGMVAVLDPVFGAQPGSDWHRVYVCGNGKVHALDARTGRSLWEEPVSCPLQPDLLLMTEHRVVLATAYQLMGVDAATGSVVWSAGSTPVEHDDAAADPESIATIYGYAYDGGRIATITKDGRAGCIEVDTGRVLWQRSLEYRPTSQPVLFGQWLVYRGRNDESTACCVVSAETGRLMRTVAVEKDSELLRIHVTMDDTLVLVYSRSMQAFDARTGLRLWSRSFADNVLDATVAFDLNAVFLSEGAPRVSRISLIDGSTTWSSESTFWTGTQSAACVPAGGQLLVVSDRGVTGLDTSDGRALWEQKPDGPMDFRYTSMGESNVLLVDSPPRGQGGVYRAYLLDYTAGGRIGDPIVLGTFDDVRNIAFRDGSIIAQVGTTVYGWSAGD